MALRQGSGETTEQMPSASLVVAAARRRHELPRHPSRGRMRGCARILPTRHASQEMFAGE